MDEDCLYVSRYSIPCWTCCTQKTTLFFLCIRVHCYSLYPFPVFPTILKYRIIDIAQIITERNKINLLFTHMDSGDLACPFIIRTLRAGMFTMSASDKDFPFRRLADQCFFTCCGRVYLYFTVIFLTGF